MTIRRGEVYQDTALGMITTPVDVVAETPKNFRCRARRKMKHPSRGWIPRGTVFLVPKDCVGFSSTRSERVEP